MAELPRQPGPDWELTAWARSSGLLTDEQAEQRFTAAGFGRLAELVYGRGPQLTLQARWLSWLFMLDDHFDEDGGEASDTAEGVLRFMPADPLEPTPAPGSPFTMALAGLWPELAAAMPGHLRHRFRGHVEAYVRSYHTEAAQARGGRAPSMTSYVELRRDSGAVETCLDLLELDSRARLTPALADLSAVRELRQAANDVICWTNDVLSYDKETACGERNNLVAVIEDERGLTRSAALALAEQMITERTGDFHRRHLLLRTAEPNGPAALFAEGAHRWITGSHRWHLESSRYRGTAICE
ncbi:hypothetical protein ACGFYV_34170 [Streptomyces sp. NPDC048297]|uniref:terpene synthase family protein n=1 Tax=Streptomyces sp. NPDC048297 TaxID=3365531 RepID=UPI00371FAEB1